MNGMIFRLTKSFEFAYGHRLLNYDGKCRYLHGHNGVVEIDVESSDLDKRGMVIDFNEIRDLIRRWVEENMDHKMILCKKDPMVDVFRKFDQPMYLMEENPTAENIARHIFYQAKNQKLNVSQVRVWETSTSCAAFSEN
tara:strand:+ start:54 stop:470 length:417 start_codon:yes stop_codon:yes gene_type:complete